MTERRYGYIHRVFGDVIWDHLLPHLRLSLYGSENLDYLNSYISEGGKVLCATNHESHLDFLLYARLLQENITSLHTLSFLASMKFFDGTMNPVVAGIAHYLAAKHDYLLLPTIQNNEYYSPSEQNRQNASTARTVKTLLNQGAAIVGLAPEGGRSEDGRVRRAHRGSGWLLRYADLYLPLGVDGTHRILPKRGIPHPLASATITIGTPLSPEELTAKSRGNDLPLHDQMMLEILKYLPPEKWGDYSEYLPSA